MLQQKTQFVKENFISFLGSTGGSEVFSDINIRDNYLQQVLKEKYREKSMQTIKIETAAEYMGKSKSTVYKYIGLGKLTGSGCPKVVVVDDLFLGKCLPEYKSLFIDPGPIDEPLPVDPQEQQQEWEEFLSCPGLLAERNNSIEAKRERVMDILLSQNEMLKKANAALSDKTPGRKNIYKLYSYNVEMGTVLVGNDGSAILHTGSGAESMSSYGSVRQLLAKYPGSSIVSQTPNVSKLQKDTKVLQEEIEQLRITVEKYKVIEDEVEQLRKDNDRLQRANILLAENNRKIESSAQNLLQSYIDMVDHNRKLLGREMMAEKQLEKQVEGFGGKLYEFG